MPAKGRHLTSLYRAFLRELPPVLARPAVAHISGFSPPAPRTHRLPIHKSLRFCLDTDTGTTVNTTGKGNGHQEETGDAAILRAEQLIRYLEAQRSYVGLLERYNAGLSDDGEERIRQAARRVGLEITDSPYVRD